MVGYLIRALVNSWISFSVGNMIENATSILELFKKYGLIA